MSGNTEMIDKLVSQQALNDMKELDEKLIHSFNEMEKLLGKVQELNIELMKSGKTYTEVTSSIEKHVNVEKEYADVNQRIINIEQRKESLTREVIQSVRSLSKAQVDLNAIGKQEEDAMKQINTLLGKTVGHRSDNLLQLIKEQDELKKTKSELKMLEKQYEWGAISQEKYTSKKLDLLTEEQKHKQIISDLQITLKNQIKIDQSLTGTMEQESLVLGNLRMAWRNLTDEQKNTAAGQQLLSTIKELDDKLKQNDATIGNHQRKIGNYEIAAKTLRGELKEVNNKLAEMILNGKKGSEAYNKLAEKAKDLTKAIAESGKETGKTTESVKKNENIFSKFTSSVNKYWAAILVGYKSVEKIFSGYKNLMMSNIGTGREFQSTMDGLSNAFDYFKTAIATMNFTNFIEGLKEANKQGKEASLMLAELFERRNSFSLSSKPVLYEIGQLMIDLRNANLTDKERIAAADEIIRKTKELKDLERDIAKQEVEANKKNLISQTKMTEAEIEYYIVNYEQNREKIKNAQELIELEKKLSDTERGALTWEAATAKVLEQTVNSLKEEVRLKKGSAEYDVVAYEAQKKYQQAGIDYVDNYVKSQEKLLNIEISLNTELRMTERLRNSLISKEEKKEEKNKNKDTKMDAEIESLPFRKRADLNERLYKNEELSYTKRRTALRQHIDDEIAIIETKALSEEKIIEATALAEGLQDELTASQKKLIKDKALYEIYKLELKYGEEIRKLRQDEIKDELEKTQEAVAIKEEKISQEMNNALLLADETYAKLIKANINNEEERDKITKEYQNKRIEIIRQHNQRIFEEEVKLLEELLKTTELGENEQREIRTKITKLRQKNAKEIADYEIEQNNRSISEMNTAEEEFNQFMSDKRTQAVMNIWSQALDMANTYYDNELQRMEEVYNREKELDDERLKEIQDNLSIGVLSQEEADARRKIIEEGQAAREKKYEEERKKIELKKAKWNKANQIIQATISTAAAVAAALPNIALSIIIGALGAAQIYQIAAQKIPEYREGTKGHPGGLAIVGDGGKSEMAILPGGKVWKTPAEAVIANLPKGTEVLSDFKQALINMASMPVMPILSDTKKVPEIITYDDTNFMNLIRSTNSRLDDISLHLRYIRGNTKFAEDKLSIRKIRDSWK
ncbi:MAG: hypothetical protein LBG15_03250 [Dysgonamonadaceae bacterium]|jgi:hypothetical protein|nr:hypothetical protein [Dysgonamonadaceae bacterium]